MGKLRIALAITDLDVGGAERCLVDLATRLDPSRFDPVVYCLGPRPSNDGESCAPALESAGIAVRYLNGRGNWQAAGLIRRMTRLLAEQGPALVQSFLFHANLAGRIAARRAGVPRVVSGVRVAEQHSRWHLWADRLTTGWVDRYACVSQAVARFTAEQGRIPPEKLVVIPNGIEVAKYPAAVPAPRESLGAGPARRLVTYVGRLERQKGVRWLLGSAPGWLSQVPDSDLLVVGKGPERSDLEALCRAHAIGDRVHFAGWRPDVPEILAASQLLVLPSLWEGMPNVVLQAMASRLPVVATDVEGVRELLGPEAACQTVPYGDSRALGEAIVRLLSRPDEANEVGQRNRRRAESEFTLQGMVTAYQDLWNSLATRH